MNNYEEHRRDLVKKLSLLPKWRQDLYFQQLKSLNFLTLDEQQLMQEMLVLENETLKKLDLEELTLDKKPSRRLRLVKN